MRLPSDRRDEHWVSRFTREGAFSCSHRWDAMTRRLMRSFGYAQAGLVVSWKRSHGLNGTPRPDST
ncbi:hypothetical protein X977_5092 [Burkholderia pseudomallei MSHR7504]|nr:hypothetical protein X977_5092 [Burkholderia pseudomallei MSHR7504]